jgi:hypothetical protein
MNTFTVEGVEYNLPEFSFDSKDDTGPLVFTFHEGDHKDVSFSIDNMRMDDKDISLMWYDIKGVDEKKIDEIKPTVDALIIWILKRGIEIKKMESSLEMSESSVKANIEYYEEVSRAEASKSIDNIAEGNKWKHIMEIKNNPKETLDEMVTATSK